MGKPEGKADPYRPPHYRVAWPVNADQLPGQADKDADRNENRPEPGEHQCKCHGHGASGRGMARGKGGIVGVEGERLEVQRILPLRHRGPGTANRVFRNQYSESAASNG